MIELIVDVEREYVKDITTHRLLKNSYKDGIVLIEERTYHMRKTPWGLAYDSGRDWLIPRTVSRVGDTYKVNFPLGKLEKIDTTLFTGIIRGEKDLLFTSKEVEDAVTELGPVDHPVFWAK